MIFDKEKYPIYESAIYLEKTYALGEGVAISSEPTYATKIFCDKNIKALFFRFYQLDENDERRYISPKIYNGIRLSAGETIGYFGKDETKNKVLEKVNTTGCSTCYTFDAKLIVLKDDDMTYVEYLKQLKEHLNTNYLTSKIIVSEINDGKIGDFHETIMMLESTIKNEEELNNLQMSKLKTKVD